MRFKRGADLVHTSLTCNPIYAFGTEEQKKKWLPPLCSGEIIGCLLLTEPNAGSDAAAIATIVQAGRR